MAVSQHDRTVLRNLASRVAEIAALPAQAEKINLWTACNDLKPERAMVLADPQGGWTEMDDAWLDLTCEDASLHGFEAGLRRKIIRHEHIHDDYPILNIFEIGLQVDGAGYDDYGPKLGVTRSGRNDGAYRIEPAIKSEADIEKLHFRPVRLDRDATDRTVDLAQDLFGDLLDVRLKGKSFWRYGLTRVLIHMRGLDQMMFDMYDNPSLLHRLMAFLRDDYMHEIDLFEQANAVSLNNTPDHHTGSGGLCPTDDLPGDDFDGMPGTRHCICWGESQETVGVGPDQFDEFVLQYQLPLLDRFGLVDYGCCEALDNKFDLLIDKIPRLRWLSVSPWADRERAAEKIGGNYVYVYKPNPSYICAPTPNWSEAEREIRETLEINGSGPTHIVMKDTHTFCHAPERITQWSDMASRIAVDMA